MDLEARIGAEQADVVVFNKGGRDFRLERIEQGMEAPREFFYGFFDLGHAGLRAAMYSSAGALPSLAGHSVDLVERAVARITHLGVRPLTARLASPVLEKAKVAISYTDGFSLSLGLGWGGRTRRPALIGGFHGLSDIEPRAPRLWQPLVRRLIRRSLAGLDHTFFFGPADREVAMERYGVKEETSSIVPFGIDTEFWRPMPEPVQDFVVAFGQDRNRDYDLLAAAPGQHPTRIITRQQVVVPEGAHHVQTTMGDFFASSSMSDEDVRRLYCAACAVVVPLKDVYQPSGYSVTLQAMSCARPVILSRIKGLWAPDVLRDGENCLLVPPHDAKALGDAIGRLRQDRELAYRLGQEGRKTVLAHFSLRHSAAGAVELAQRGLELYERNHLR